MKKYPEGRCDAEQFCLAERAWVLETAQRTSERRSLKGYHEDIAQEVFKKARQISNDKWSEKRNPKAYIARIIINLANDLCHVDHDLEPLTEIILASTPTEAMQAAILIQELYNKLTGTEQALFELMFQETSGAEIAEKLGIKPATARKRVSRLKEKLFSMSQGRQVLLQAESIGTESTNRQSIRCSN
jgi:RNA polymerase sigma factor (sigma-70 family)